jgi:hypothetical protein
MVGFFTLGGRAETAATLLCSFPVASVLDGTEKGRLSWQPLHLIYHFLPKRGHGARQSRL